MTQTGVHDGLPALERLELLLGQIADGVTVQAPDGRLLYANRAAARLVGVDSPAELVAMPVHELLSRFEVLDEEGQRFDLDLLPGRTALAEHRSAEATIRYRVLATGEEFWALVRATPITDELGRLEGAVTVFHDITASKRAEAGLRFLAEASELLAESLDYDRTLARVARLAVPQHADWCMVYIREADGRIERLAVEHASGRHVGVLDALRHRAFKMDADTGVPRVVRTGEPLLYREADSRLVASDVEDADTLAAELESLGIVSWMCVPLIARGQTIGAISLLAAESNRRFDATDLALAQELARRAALAVDNARLFRDAADTAATLDTLLARAPIGLAFWDRDLRYVRINDALAEMNGLPAADHLGRRLRDVLPTLGPLLEPVYRRILETGEPVLDQEVAGETPAQPGVIRDWVTSYYPVASTTGEIIGLGGVVLEVTDRKRSEQAVKEALAREREARAIAEQGAQRLRGLQAVSEAGIGDEGLEHLLNELLGRIRDLVGTDTAAILLLDETGRDLVARAARGLEEEVERGVRIPVGGGFAGRIAAERRPIVLHDVDHADVLNPLLREKGIKSLLGVPLAVEGRVLGVLHVGTLTPRLFDDDDTMLLQLAADRAAAAIEQSRLYEAEREARAAAERASERLQFLAEASRVLSRSLDYETTLREVARLAVPDVTDWCALDVIGDDAKLRRLAVTHADPAKERLAHELAERYPPDPDAPRGPSHVARTGEPEILAEVGDDLLVAAARDDDHLELLRALGLSSYLAVPVRARRGILAVMTWAHADSGRRFDDEDLALAEEIARRAAVAIENARLYGEARRRARAAQALRFVGDGVVLLDSDGVVRLWNPAAEAITGLRVHDVLGRRAADAIPGWEQLVAHVPVGGRAETVPLAVGGHDVWLSISGVAFATGTVYAFRDMTSEHAVEKMKSDFVSTVSHELRTPLAAIYGAAQTLRRSDVALAAVDREELLGMISAEAERLARIVNDILWASRLDADAMPLSIESTDAAALARAVVGAARMHVPANVSVEIRAPSELPPVAADADKVRQVLTNLVENAVKYSPEGGRVEVSLEPGAGVMRFSVRDEGLGIPAGERERIFEKFYRLDPDLTRGVGGTGLGLYICRELVSRMGGRLWVESTEGAGSTFAFDLPLADSYATTA